MMIGARDSAHRKYAVGRSLVGPGISGHGVQFQSDPLPIESVLGN